MLRVSDKELIRRVNGGDLPAYAEIVARYEYLVLGVAYHKLGDFKEAHEVMQDVFIHAFARIDQLPDVAKIGTWLRQIAVSECRAWRSARRNTAPLPYSEVPSNEIPISETRIALHEALAKLDESSRLTGTLFYLHAYPLKEIGKFLNESVSTIESRVKTIRLRLRNEMKGVFEGSQGSEAQLDDFAQRVTGVLTAAKEGDEASIRELLLSDPQLATVREEPGMGTPLHFASGAGHVAIVQLLLANGADPNALDVGDNASPLHYAAERGRLEIVKLLVEAGADVNWNADVHERGPLGWSVIFGTVQRDVAKYLMSMGAQPDLFVAIALGHEDLVKSLVQADPAVLQSRMSKCEQFRSPIEFAASYRRFAIGELLVELGSEVTLSEAAALGRDVDVARLLPERPEDPAVEAALHAAVASGQSATSRQLLEFGADSNSVRDGRSPLFLAVDGNYPEVARVLLEFGGDLELQDGQWNSTPLGWQVFYGRPETTRLALDLGAKVGPKLLELARSGEKGELRSWTSAPPEDYRTVFTILSKHCS